MQFIKCQESEDLFQSYHATVKSRGNRRDVYIDPNLAVQLIVS